MSSILLANCLKSKLSEGKISFQDEFGRHKPHKHELIVLSGNCNRQNLGALETMRNLKFTRVADFVGGYEEWTRQYESCGAFQNGTSCHAYCDPQT